MIFKTKKILLVIILFICFSCSSQKPLILYNNDTKVEGDEDLTEFFQNQLKDKIEEGGYSIYIKPYLEGFIILEGSKIYFQKEDSEEDDILGRTWILKEFNKNNVYIEYNGIKYNIQFNKDYRYITVDFNNQKQKLLIEYCKLPWVSYHE